MLEVTFKVNNNNNNNNNNSDNDNHDHNNTTVKPAVSLVPTKFTEVLG